MAKAIAVCTCTTCGKTFEKTSVRSNRRDADSWEAWASNTFDECPDCYKLRKQQERELANKRAKERASELGLPELFGSEKQIAWATKIRDESLKNLNTILKKQEERFHRSGKEKYAERIKVLQLTKSHMEKQRSASWWIGFRGAMTEDFVLDAGFDYN